LVADMGSYFKMSKDITAIFSRRFGIDHVLEKHINKTGFRFIFNTKDSTFSEYSSPSFTKLTSLKLRKNIFHMLIAK